MLLAQTLFYSAFLDPDDASGRGLESAKGSVLSGRVAIFREGVGLGHILDALSPSRFVPVSVPAYFVLSARNLSVVSCRMKGSRQHEAQR